MDNRLNSFAFAVKRSVRPPVGHARSDSGDRRDRVDENQEIPKECEMKKTAIMILLICMGLACILKGIDSLYPARQWFLVTAGLAFCLGAALVRLLMKRHVVPS